MLSEYIKTGKIVRNECVGEIHSESHQFKDIKVIFPTKDGKMTGKVISVRGEIADIKGDDGKNYIVSAKDITQTESEDKSNQEFDQSDIDDAVWNCSTIIKNRTAKLPIEKRKLFVKNVLTHIEKVLM